MLLIQRRILSLAGAAISIIFVDTSFVATKKSFIATKVCLSRQNFCHDKQEFCRDKGFVAARILLSRQRTCFVATKMMLVAASASDSVRLKHRHSEQRYSCHCEALKPELEMRRSTSVHINQIKRKQMQGSVVEA